MAEPFLDVPERQLEIVQAILDHHVPEREVWAFGSRVRGTAKRWSDLDLVVIGDTPLDLSTAAALDEAFRESDLPWKVDVVDWATTSPGFRALIARNHVVLRLGRSEADAARR